MRLTSLISRLQEIHAEHGDMDVVTQDLALMDATTLPPEQVRAEDALPHAGATWCSTAPTTSARSATRSPRRTATGVAR